MCGPKGYGFSAVLVINRVWFLYSNLEFGMFFLEGATFSLLSIRPTIKALHNTFNIGLNYVTYYKAGLKQGIEGSGHN